MPPQRNEGFYSSLGLKVHKSRGNYIRGLSGDLWLQEKGENDGAEGLWRVHDDLYDLTDFVDHHPGGSMWLKLTKYNFVWHFVKTKCKMPPQGEEGFYSSLGFKIHKSRGDYIRGLSGDLWLQEKGDHDGAEGLWRVHDDLYDLTDFVDHHPGGSMWLKLTKGTDITEAFESHHVSVRPENILPKFQVRKATTPRNSPFTFKEDGFYKTLKKEAREELQKVPASAARMSNIITDALLLGYILLAIYSVKYFNYYLATFAGNFLALVTISAHNYFHQKDNFRMYYFDLSCLSSREWRISHTLSHHMYTNTVIDLQLQLCEPLIQLLPVKKRWLVKYGSWFYFPIVFLSIFALNYIKRICYTVESLRKGRSHEVEKRILIPLIVPTLMYLCGGKCLGTTLLLWIYIICVGSFHFAWVGLNSSHQGPDIFHDGDTTRGKTVDWGISQLDTTMDRYDITGSHFLVLTNFGDHGLHHLFPAVDHGKLSYLYPTLERVCKMFNVELRINSQLQMIKKMFLQLARTKPNPFPPGYKNK